MSDILYSLERQRAARAATIEALAEEAEPSVIAVRLENAAKLVRDAVDPLDDTREGLFWRDYAEALGIGAELHLWDAAVHSGEQDADRHVRAARRRLETLRVYVDDPLFAPLSAALNSLGAVAEPWQISDGLAALARVPVPLKLLERRRERKPPRRGHTQKSPAQPLIVCMFEIDGAVVTHPQVLQLRRVYEVRVRLRVPEWPEWARALRLEFLSVLPRDDLHLPIFELPRPSTKDVAGAWSAEGLGSLVLRVSQAPGARPLRPTVAATFVSGRRVEPARVAGYTELRLRSFDPTRDRLTGRSSIDERLLGMYAQLWGGTVPDAEIEAFCRFFTAISLAAQGIQADRAYGEGKRISEAHFHEDLERRLRGDATLGNRLERRTPAGGGYVDLLHDSINAELKVARGAPVTVESAVKYVGQPTQYAMDLGTQLAILCILDQSAKRAPVGELPNYVGWVVPTLHGLDDPRYPSRIGVIIVNANLPSPSDWSRRGATGTRRSRRRRSRPESR